MNEDSGLVIGRAPPPSILGRVAHRHSLCISATLRKTEEDMEPIIDLTKLKAFFKALVDAPEDQIADANGSWTCTPVRRLSTSCSLSGGEKFGKRSDRPVLPGCVKVLNRRAPEVQN